MNSPIDITPANENTDWNAVTAVFNYYVEHSPAAYPDEPVSSGFFLSRWQTAPQYPFYTVVSDDRVIGFGYLAPFHPVRTMSRTATLTYFILPEHTGGGIGAKVLNLLISEGIKIGITNYLAHISSLNHGSIHFHLQNGFTECGRFKSVGSKHGQDFDMVWMQRIEA